MMNNFAAKALKNISPVYDNSAFIKYFFNAVGIPFELMTSFFETLAAQSFPDLVTWLIETQEDKYSVPHRRDLTLEERRALLKIKTSRHLPLNPAVLEKSILEQFDLLTFLKESEPGYIKMLVKSLTPESWLGATSFLLKEKPAHLALKGEIQFIDYAGEGSAPDEIFPDDIPLPKTPDDKKFFPRIFVGTAQILSGQIKTDLSKPKNEKINLTAASAQILFGQVKVDLSKPKNQLIKIHAATGIKIGGTIKIACADSPKKIKETPVSNLLIAGVGIAR